MLGTLSACWLIGAFSKGIPRGHVALLSLTGCYSLVASKWPWLQLTPQSIWIMRIWRNSGVRLRIQDGIWLSWNVFPSSQMVRCKWTNHRDCKVMALQEASWLVVPIGALYTPLKEKPDTLLLQIEPIICKPPGQAVLNPFWLAHTFMYLRLCWHQPVKLMCKPVYGYAILSIMECTPTAL